MDKIVIIEDDPCIRTVLRLALKGAGYSALYEADRGDDGLALVLREQPALVLLDLMLPGLDGLSVCREIRRSETVSTTPIIMLTAKSAESGAEKGLNLLTQFHRYNWSYPFIFLMRRVRVLGIGSDDKPLLQHRREAIPVEVNPALDPDRLAKRCRFHRPVGQECQDPLDNRRVAALQL